MAGIIDLKNSYSFKQTQLDLTIQTLTNDEVNSIFGVHLAKSLSVRKVIRKNSSGGILS